MYRIDEESGKEKYIMLIPAMLDAHFPLLKYAFYSQEYHPVILENEEGITDIGLKYVNNDMCYPAILNVGQMIGALQSGAYDLNRTVLLMPQAGDACRGSNYTGVLRRGVSKAGFEKVPVLSLNVKGMEKSSQVKLTPGMVWRALFSVFYGDMLMILSNQMRPYEKTKGETEKCVERWTNTLAEELKKGKHLSFGRMKKNFQRMAEEFAAIPKKDITLPKIGIVGELYTKYCHLGNWNLEKILQKEKCEYYINGLTWYVLYYIDTHLTTEGKWMGLAYRLGLLVIGRLQHHMVQAIKRQGLYCMDEFSKWKKEADGYVNYHCSIGDGWLIGAEAVNHIKNGYKKVLALQPFGCMPNHVSGRGIYPSIQRKLPEGQIISVDYDSSGSELNVKNRVMMILSEFK